MGTATVPHPFLLILLDTLWLFLALLQDLLAVVPEVVPEVTTASILEVSSRQRCCDVTSLSA